MRAKTFLKLAVLGGLTAVLVWMIAAYNSLSVRRTIPYHERITPYVKFLRYASVPNGFCTFSERLSGMRGHLKVESLARDLMRRSTFKVRDAHGFELWQTPEGEYWLPKSNDLLSLAVILAEQRLHMYGEPGSFGVHKGDVVLDCGAHVGLFTLSALKAGAAKVVAVEPTPESAECFRRNVGKELESGRVVLLEEGVSDAPGTLEFGRSEYSFANYLLSPDRPAAATFKAKLTTIDEIAGRLRLDRIDFIKLDVENAELRALRGATKTLARDRPRMAVAAENALDRHKYLREILSEVARANAEYRSICGVCSPSDSRSITPEILHFY